MVPPHLKAIVKKAGLILIVRGSEIPTYKGFEIICGSSEEASEIQGKLDKAVSGDKIEIPGH